MYGPMIFIYGDFNIYDPCAKPRDICEVKYKRLTIRELKNHLIEVATNLIPDSLNNFFA